MDAGLAKVMNSSVGTSAVKALDTLLKTDNTTIANNAADRLFNSLKNSAKLVGSDEVMFVYSGDWVDDNSFGGSFNGCRTSSFIQFDTSGTVVFKTIQTGNRTDGNKHTFNLRAYDASGNQIRNVRADLSNGTTAEIQLSMNVTAGAKYKIGIGCYNTGYPAQFLDVCGTMVLFSATATLSS
jgi:hypothetical protein